MHNGKTAILTVALAIPLAALALPFVLKAQTYPWPPYGNGSSSSRAYEYFCNGTVQSTPCSSANSSRPASSNWSRPSSSSSRPYEYFCNGTAQSTPCSAASSSAVSSACVQPVALYSDLSVMLDTEQSAVRAGETITYSVKVRNGGKDNLNSATVFLLRNDMNYVQSSANCFVQASDPTYVRCTVPPVSAGQAATFTVTLQAASDFTCIDSKGGRSVFAFVRAPSGGNQDLYPQNNTSNIINTMPACL